MNIKHCVLAVILGVSGQFAFGNDAPRGREMLPNFDRRLEKAAVANGAAASHQRAAEVLAAQIAGVQIARDAATGAPKWIGSTTRWLTGPDGEGGAVKTTTAAAFGKGDRHRAVKAFLNEHRELLGHDATLLARAQITREDVSPSGLRTIVWQQFFEGIPVFEGVLKAALTRRGELVNVGTQFVAAPAAAVRGPRVSAARALVLAAQQTGANFREEAVVAKGAAAGAQRRQSFDAPELNGGTAQLTWLPLNADALRLCWSVIFTNATRGELFRVLVDAETGEAHLRHCLTEYLTDASYRVFTSDSPTPMSPGLAIPGSAQPPEVARTLVTTPALNTTASPSGWIDDGVNETRGNNVDAHLDLDRNNQPDLPRPQGSPARVFDFALDLTQAPSTYRDAAVTNLFYWCNRLHDRYYELGFTESAGNFQNDNFSRGGNGNDALNADAQDGSGTNNANFSFQPDGSRCRIQMYLWSGPAPDRDGDFDAEIVIHEYTHGLSNRLVGGGSGITALQARGMGEGWSDFYALSLLSEAGDDVDGNYALGSYATLTLGGTFSENYYYGIRRYPYSTDLSKNPLTFRDIDPTQADPHTRVPLSPRTLPGADPSQVHRQGEVWCVTLWEARANLVKKLGFPAGNDLILQIVTDGLKLTPSNPTFLQARDAILQAELVLTGGAQARELWAAFAKRGMGLNASAPASNSTVGVIENHDVADDLFITPVTSLEVSGDFGGPFTPGAQTYTLRNRGAAALAWTATKTQPWLTLSADSGTLAPGDSATVLVTINAAAAALALGTATDAVMFSNAASGVTLPRSVNVAIDPPRVYYFPLETDPGWTRTGEWAFGRPLGQGAAAGVPPGFADPTSGATGANVFGVNLAGTYALSGGPYFVTTAALNCAGLLHTYVRFQRWLNTPEEFSADATLEISTDGATWTSVWKNGNAAVTDASWRKVRYDISAIADGQPTVFLRWGNRINPGTVATYSGWNIDDIEILGTPENLRMELPTVVTEGQPMVTGTLIASPVLATDAVVHLAVSDATRLSVPATITIPAGTPTASFPVTPIDNALLDGPQTVTITPTAVGLSSRVATVLVQDNETATLGVSLPASTTEGSGNVIGILTVSAPPTHDTAVSLVSNPPFAVRPPPSVTVRAGETSVEFPVTIPDDTSLNGTRNVTVTAHVANWTDGNATITIFDNDVANLTLEMAAIATEGRNAGLGLARISGTLASDLVVTLASDDITEIRVPGSVTIPAGGSSATFPLTAVDDSSEDGAQTVHVTATAPGFNSATATIVVQDDEVHHLSFTPIPSPQIRGAPFFVVVTFKNLNGGTTLGPSNFLRLSLTARSGGTELPISPSQTQRLLPSDKGVWAGFVMVNGVGNNVVLTADDMQGHTNTSNPFDVVIGPVDRFTWEPIVAPRSVGVPFTAEVRALDRGGNTVSTYTDSATLAALRLTVRPPVSSGGFNGNSLFARTHPGIRVQRICPAFALGGAGKLTALAVNAMASKGDFFKEWTIRLKHTALDTFSAPLWDTDGWTVVHVSDARVVSSGWQTFQFQTPFEYNGVNNLMVDFSFQNPPSPGESRAHTATHDPLMREVAGYSDVFGSDPRAWANDGANVRKINTSAVDVQFTTAESVAIDPSLSSAFIDGVWRGSVAIAGSGEAISVRASNASGVRGDSAPFPVDLLDLDGDSLPDAWADLYGVHGAFNDPDEDGLNNFLEHALGLNPIIPQAALPLPYFVSIVDDDEVDTYLTWTYRRLLNPRGLIYSVEVSDDLETWRSGPEWIQQVDAPVANTDGVTETVTVRAFPAYEDDGDEEDYPPQGPRFLRLRVTGP